MSDCANGGRGRWAGVEWRQPAKVAPRLHDEHPCSVAVLFSDGTSRELVLELAGREVASVSVDGEAYLPSGVEVEEHFDRGVRYAVTIGGTRYVRARSRDFDAEGGMD